VIVTKKAVPSSSKKVARAAKNTNEVRPTLKKQQGQVDQDGK
jgi:hypothetical protein